MSLPVNNATTIYQEAAIDNATQDAKLPLAPWHGFANLLQ
jgi:hypothetical protein